MSMRLLGALLGTLTSAFAYGLTFPPTRLRLLAWVALVPFFVAIRSVGLREALFLTWIWTVAAAYAVGDWFPRAVATFFQQPALVGIGFFFAVSSLMAAPYYMVFTACYRKLSRSASATVPLLAAMAWVAVELGRVKLLTGNPWALFGYSQVGVIRLMQIADITGVYGISFILVSVNAAVAESWLAIRTGEFWDAGMITTGCLAIVPTVFAMTYGLVRPGFVTSSNPDASLSQIAIIQGNLNIGTQWQPDFYGKNLDVYLALTLDQLRRAKADVAVWPEDAMTFFLNDESGYQKAIGRVIALSDTELIAGGPRRSESGGEIYYNSAFLLSPDGSIVGHYDKEHLLPFAEYFPLGVDLLRRRFGGVREFHPGAPTPPLSTAAGRAGIVICNEAMFPELAARRVRAGASYLVNLANDFWPGEQKFAEQQFDIATLRAVEQRRYLVRASTSGPSAVVDPIGRVLVGTESFSRAAIVGSLFPLTLITFYCRVGDLFAFVCMGIAIVVLVMRT